MFLLFFFIPGCPTDIKRTDIYKYNRRSRDWKYGERFVHILAMLTHIQNENYR